MGVLRYYGRVFRVAFSPSLSATQSVIFGLILLTGVAAFVAGRLKLPIDLKAWQASLTGWSIAVTVFVLIVGTRLLLAPYWMHKGLEEKVLQATRHLPIVEIAKVRFDENALTELYLDLVVSNPGGPTVVRNWLLLIRPPGSREAHRFAPRWLNAGVFRNGFGNVEQDDLAKKPLDGGERRECGIGFTIEGLPVRQRFGAAGTRFDLSAEDVRGNKFAGTHILP